MIYYLLDQKLEDYSVKNANDSRKIRLIFRIQDFAFLLGILGIYLRDIEMNNIKYHS